MRVIRQAYGPKKRQQIHFPEHGRTKQAMQAECDINNIMAKYQRTGMIDFVNKHAAHYGDCTAIDFQKSMQTVITMREMFSELTSSVRKRFDNDPEKFLNFMENAENRQEAIQLGLIEQEGKRKGDEAPLPRKRRTGDSEAPAEPKKADTDA